jgi:hypothetical protein
MQNFWDMSYLWYMIGFVFAPRLTVIMIIKNYVTGSFDYSTLLVGITIWWKFPALALGFGSKLGFTSFYCLFPRLLLGIIGYNYLSPGNHTAMIIFCVLGFLIDLAARLFNAGNFLSTKESPNPNAA